MMENRSGGMTAWEALDELAGGAPLKPTTAE